MKSPDARVAGCWLLVAGCFTALSIADAEAGSGEINIRNGVAEIDLSARFDYNVSSNEIDHFKNEMRKASSIVWDMTEGKVRINKVDISTFTSLSAGPDIRVISSNSISPYANFDGLGRPGRNITLTDARMESSTIAHEFGHYLFGLGDEYYIDAPQCRNPGGKLFSPNYIDGMGVCNASFATGRSCIMQNSSPGASTELCMASNHDPIQGQYNQTRGFCAAGDSDIKTTAQTHRHTHSCWETLISHSKFASLFQSTANPTTQPPPGFVPPIFSEEGRKADRISMLLDVSGSMEWRIDQNASGGEICFNRIDDDGDGQTDESDCGESRLGVMTAAARSFVYLARNQNSPIGLTSIVTFNSSAQIQVPEEALTRHTYQKFYQEIDNIFSRGASGRTSIGDGLLKSRYAFENGILGLHSGMKAILLFSDGRNTAGSDPLPIARDLAEEGIHIVPIGTGEALDGDFLFQLSQNSDIGSVGGAPPRFMISSFVNAYAQMKKRDLIIPRLGYRLGNGNGTSDFPVIDGLEIDGNSWREYDSVNPDEMYGADEILINFNIPETKTNEIEIIFASTSTISQGVFGVRAHVIDPQGQVYDLSNPSASVEVERDPYFTIAKINTSVVGGDWQVHIEADSSAGRNQTGTFTVIADLPETDLVAGLENASIELGQDAVLNFKPRYVSALQGITQGFITVRAPDRTEYYYSFQEKDPGAYFSILDNIHTVGTHEVYLELITDSRVINEPGERFGAAPLPGSNIKVPRMKLTKLLTLNVSPEGGDDE